MTIEELRTMKCRPLKGKEHMIAAAQAVEYLRLLPGWQSNTDNTEIHKNFKFRDFSQALGFVNALGWIAEAENHHPDLELGWGRCLVRFSTHDVGGLSQNDFICAAKVETLLSP